MALTSDPGRLRARAERMHAAAMQRRNAKKQQVAAQQNDPNRVIARLTPKTLEAQVKKAAAGQFAPEENAIRQQMKDAQFRDNKELPSWFEQYRQQIEQSEQATKSAYAQTQQDADARTQRTQAAEDARQASMNEAQQQDAAIRGTSVSGVPSQMGQQAQVARRVLMDSYGAKLGAQGASATGYFEAGKANASRQLIDERQKIDRSYSKQMGELGAVKAQRGSYANEYRDKLREGERQFALEQETLLSKEQQQALQGQATRSLIRQRGAQIRQNDRRLDLEAKRIGISRGQLRLGQNRLGETQNHNQAMEQLKQSGFSLTQRKFLWQQHVDHLKATGKWKGSGKGGSGGSGGKESQYSFKAKGGIQDAMSQIKQLRSGGAFKTHNDLYQYLIRPKGTKQGQPTGMGLSPLQVTAAFELLAKGSGQYLSRSTIQKLRRAGITVPKRWINPGMSRPYRPRQSGDTSTRPG